MEFKNKNLIILWKAKKIVKVCLQYSQGIYFQFDGKKITKKVLEFLLTEEFKYLVEILRESLDYKG